MKELQNTNSEFYIDFTIFVPFTEKIYWVINKKNSDNLIFTNEEKNYTMPTINELFIWDNNTVVIGKDNGDISLIYTLVPELIDKN